MAISFLQKCNRQCLRLSLAVLLLSVWNMPPVFAQDGPAFAQGGQARIKDLLVKAQQAYYKTPYLSFRVKYLYANEGQNSGHLDSLTGQVQMDKDRCRLTIDGTETVITPTYAIQVIKEDKAIYLSKAHPAGVLDPVSMLDSVFAHMDGVKAEIGKEEGSDVVTLEFPPGQTYSRIRMIIDGQTGFFRQISYSLRTAGLVAPEQIERPGHPAPYREKGQVDIVFSHYEHGRFGDELFRESNFFNKTAGRFEAAGQYKDYQIFLASSNL
jgi:hypothetical protein